MKQIEEQLKRRSESIRLTSKEKEEMRTAIGEHMRAHPLAVEEASGWRVTQGWQWAFMPRFALPVLAVVLCASTAYAAQGSIPGDVLYPVKIHVNEPVAVGLALSDSAKALVNASIASQRIEEAQQLAARGTLDASTTEQLETNFDTHATAAALYASTAAAQNPVEGAQLQTQLNVLGAQGAVLAEIGNSEGNAQVEESSHNLITHIQTAILAVAAASSTQTAPANAASAQDDQTASTAIRAQALAELSLVQETSTSTLDASTTTALNSRIAEVQNLIALGDTATSSARALHSYAQALSLSAVLETFLHASVQFKGDILSSLLNIDLQNQATTSPKDGGTAKHILRHLLQVGTASNTLPDIVIHTDTTAATSSSAISPLPASSSPATWHGSESDDTNVSSETSVPTVIHLLP